MSRRALAGGCLALALAAAALGGSAARAETPVQLFAADSSGMLQVRAVCAPGKAGRQQGSAFLLGPRLMMTARHVLIDNWTGKGCKATVVQEGTHKTAHVVRWMAIRTAKTEAPTDLAIAVLDTPLEGHNFSLSAASPKRGARVVVLGYALGQPLSLNQGHVARLTTTNHVRVLEMNVLTNGGGSGGPVLDAKGNVVGLTQYSNTRSLKTVDLAHLVHHDPTQFCFGAAAGQASTICPARQHPPTLLSRDGPPHVCAGRAIALPFVACPAFVDDLTGIVKVRSRCSKTGVGEAVGFLLGPRLMMTSRQILTDGITGAGCAVTVLHESTGKYGPVVRWMAVSIAGTDAPTDIALAVLGSPIKGTYFTLSPTSPKPGELVHALSYDLGWPSRDNQDHVVKLPTLHDVRLLQLSSAPSTGSGGGPIVNAKNEVVGLTQWGFGAKGLLSVDVAHMVHGDATQLCFGVAAGQASTICPAHKPAPPTVLSRADAAEVCNGQAAVAPFSVCPPRSAAPSIVSCWISSHPTGDGSGKIHQVADASPTVYFWEKLSAPATKETKATDTLTSPTGFVRTVVRNRSLGSLEQVFGYGPVPWPEVSAGLIPDGPWTFTTTLSSGATCSYVLTATR